MPAGKCAHGTSATSTLAHLPASPIVYRDGVSRDSLELVQRDRDEYRGMQSAADETSREAGADEASLEELLEQ